MGDVHVEIESCRLDFYKRVSNARFMGKGRTQRKHQRKGRTQEKKKKKKQDQRLASNQSGSHCGSCAAATWVAHGPVSHCGPGSRADLGRAADLGLMRWSGSGVVWLDRVMGSLVLSKNSQDL